MTKFKKKATDIFIKNVKKEKNLTEHNAQILANIVDFWFFHLEVYISEFSFEKLELLIKENKFNLSLQRTIQNEVYGYEKLNKKFTKKKFVYKFTNKYLVLILLFFLNHEIFLSGSSHKCSKIKGRLSNYFISFFLENKSLKVSKKLKNNFFYDLENKKIYQKKELAFIKDIIPDIFFMENISKNFLSNSIKINCSPSIFVEDEKYLPLLYLFNLVEIIGFQHGGGYGVWKDHALEEYEKKISKSYNLWFPHSPKSEIGRYDYLTTNKYYNLSKVYWVGRTAHSKYMNNFIPNYLKKNEINKVLHRIDDIFFSLDEFYYLPGIKKDWLPNKSKVRDHEQNAEKIIFKRDVLIFDCFYSSLIYFAIKNKIVFYIIISKTSMEGLNPMFLNWLEILHKNNFLYFIEENKMQSLYEKINLMTKNNIVFQKEKKKLEEINS